uniref:Mucin-21-like n=1 Tax=Saccoglossus kowalevskii TaxID=10224 RepID=A0ABM0M144_SACKO|nr:PREDICTED: mucin-21-like [Saccoglossus kowalevskii]
MYRQKLQQGNRTSDRVQSSPGNLRDRSVLTNRNKSKDTEWELLSAWDIGDDSDEIGGLGIVSWNKRSAKPKPETNHAHSQNAWQQYLCTTGTKCTYIEDVKEFVESSLDPRLKPRARSAPERPSVSEIVSEIKEDKKDITKSKHLNGIYSSTKTFDQKRTLMHRASAGSYGSHRTAGHHGGSSESARHRSSSSGDISNSRTAKSAINMSRLIISIGERKHDLAIKNGKSTEKQNGINNKTFSDKKTPTFSRSTETSGAATPNESPPTPIPAPRTENDQSPNAVKFSYTKSKTPGSTTTLLSDNTDSSSGRDSATNGDERNLHSSPSKRAHFIYQPESTASYYPRANIDHKLQKHTSKCNVFDSQTVSVSDILNSTPRLERHITLTENDSPQGAKNNNRFKVKTPSKDSHRTDKTEGSSFPPVYSRPTTETSTQSLQLTHNGTSAKTLPRVSSTSKLVGDAENGSEIGYCENGQIEEGYIDPESELGMVMLREGVDLSRFTEKL